MSKVLVLEAEFKPVDGEWGIEYYGPPPVEVTTVEADDEEIVTITSGDYFEVHVNDVEIYPQEIERELFDINWPREVMSLYPRVKTEEEAINFLLTYEYEISNAIPIAIAAIISSYMGEWLEPKHQKILNGEFDEDDE